MKLIFNLLITILLIPYTAEAHSTSISLNNDTSGEHHATGVAFIFDESETGTSYLKSLGISANTIRSNLALESADRHRIFPVYIFINFSLKHSISPFVEFGVDLGDALLDKVFDGDGKDVDIYYSLGIRIKIKKTIGLSFYRKTYDLYFNEIDDPALQNANLDVTGIKFSYYFE